MQRARSDPWKFQTFVQWEVFGKIAVTHGRWVITYHDVISLDLGSVTTVHESWSEPRANVAPTCSHKHSHGSLLTRDILCLIVANFILCAFNNTSVIEQEHTNSNVVHNNVVKGLLSPPAILGYGVLILREKGIDISRVGS